MRTLNEGDYIHCPHCGHRSEEPVEDWTLVSGLEPNLPDICDACENVIWVRRTLQNTYIVSSDKREIWKR